MKNEREKTSSSPTRYVIIIALDAVRNSSTEAVVQCSRGVHRTAARKYHQSTTGNTLKACGANMAYHTRWVITLSSCCIKGTL